MTQPAPNGQAPQTGKPAFDPVNQFQAEFPWEWTTATADLPGLGQRGVLCLRVPNTTFSLVMAKDDLDGLIGALQMLRGRMNGLILPPSGG